MDRDRVDIRPRVEDSLRAVAVMDVDVEDHDTLVPLPQMRRRDPAVVEEAEAAGHVAIGVMAGRPAERIGRILAVHHHLCRGDRDVGRSAGRSPGARADRRRGVGGVPAELAGDMGGISRGMAHRMDIADHLRAGIAERGPGLPGLAQERQIFRTVDARTRSLPECGRLDQLMLAVLEPFEQAVGTFGLLGGPLDHTANQEELRIVAAMQLGMDGFHSNTPWSL